ncbi:MAG TPA: hypothetical protein VHU18_03345 [Rhizomicrobium sp.]|nr:hypothetical protein [Rhizomicrobium sp.]
MQSSEATESASAGEADAGERIGSAEGDDDGQQSAFSIEDELEEAASSNRVASRGRIARILSNPASIGVVTGDERQTAQLFRTLKSAFEERGIKLSPTDGDPDLAIYLVDSDEIPDFRPGRSTTAIIAIGRNAAVWRRSALTWAKAHRVAILSTDTLVRRYGESRIVSEAGSLGERGTILASALLRDSLLVAQTDTLPPSISHIGEAADFVDAIQSSNAPAEFLKLLHWPGGAPPRSLRAPLDPTVIEHFLDGNISLTISGERQATPYYIPSDWTANAESRADQFALHGLDFVASVLNYWYLRANGTALPKLVSLGNTLKDRGITASTLLMAAGAIILDALTNSEKFPPFAWDIAYVQRRARACELFLLCCRIAMLKRIRFDEAACASVFRGLIELLERLRIATFTNVGSTKRVAEAAVLTTLAIPLRKMTYGTVLLEETLDGLCSYQLESGMSLDGVWHGGFAEQCSILGVLRLLAADLRAAEISAIPVTAAIAKLEPFTTVFISSEGMIPPISESPPTIGKKPGAAVKRVQSPLSGGPLREAAVFPDGGFFISRSIKKGALPSSHLVLQARPTSLGGPSLSFSVGLNVLLIGGGTLARRAPPEARAATRENPAAHNAVRINRQDYLRAQDTSEEAIRIENAWEDKEWAAARLANQAFSQAFTARTVIHLKPDCALLVVDEFSVAAGTADFEVFWHLAHGLRKTGGLSFECPKGGILNTAFAGGAEIQTHRGGENGIGWANIDKRQMAPNPYLVCTINADDAVCASFFRWSAKPLGSQIKALRVADGWSASVGLGDRSLHFVYSGGQLRHDI